MNLQVHVHKGWVKGVIGLGPFEPIDNKSKLPSQYSVVLCTPYSLLSPVGSGSPLQRTNS
jgi:hypothetical protein